MIPSCSHIWRSRRQRYGCVAAALQESLSRAAVHDLLAVGRISWRAGTSRCNLPVRMCCHCRLNVDACLPVVEIGTDSMKLCTGVFETNTACTTYTAATYAAAQVRWLPWRGLPVDLDGLAIPHSPEMVPGPG